MSASARILWGYEASNASSRTARVGVYTDFTETVNPHMMITGDSGTGKTHTIRHCVTEVLKSSPHRVRFHIFDPHGDIEIPGDQCSTVMFSASSPYGFNPLLINPDPHFGGVRRAIQDFIATLSLSPTHGRALGPKQQDVLRNLLLDVYELAGYDAADPSTWQPTHEGPKFPLNPGRTYIDLPYEELNLGKRCAQDSGIDLTFDRDNRCWHVDEYEGPITRWPRKAWGRVNPTLSTLVAYATRRRAMSFTGMGQRESSLLDTFHRKAKALSLKHRSAARARNNNGAQSAEDDKLREELDKAREAALSAYTDYLQNVEHGSALESMLKYDSFDSLSTVKQIIDSLDASGIFRDTPPNFDGKAPVWRYNIKPLDDEYKKFAVNVRLRDIFNRAVQRGECSHLREVIIIDEGAKFVEKDDEHIINKIALEARKFGLAIWFASQSPTQYPESLLSTMATKVILGLDPSYWPLSQRQLRINPNDMSWVRPREGLLLNRKLSGQSAQPWVRVTTIKAPTASPAQTTPGRGVDPVDVELLADDGFSGRFVSNS